MFRPCLRVYFTIVLLTLATCPGITQNSFLVTHYSKQDYKAGNQNWSLDTDKDGFIYAANNDGLLMFDGTKWELFSNADQTIVRSVYVSPDGRIYTGSFEECGYWEKDINHELTYISLKPLMKQLNLHNDEIWKIIPFKGKIYFQSFTSLLVYDQKNLRSIRVPGTIIFLLKARDHLFVQSVTGMLYEIKGETLTSVDPSNNLKRSEVKTILPLPDETYLIGTTSHGLFKFDGKSIVPWNVEANIPLKESQINNAMISGNHIVVGTIVRGIYILDFQGRIVAHLNTENYLQNNTVLSLCSDINGNIWAGLDKGIDRISVDPCVSIYQEKLEQLGAVYTGALYDNALYIGTNRGVFYYNPDPVTSDFRFSGFINNSQGQVWDLENIDGSLICGHTNGTYQIKGNTLKRISDVSGGYAFRKIISRDGEHLIQSTYSPLVIYCRRNGDWAFLHSVKGYQEPSRFLETDHLGNIWIGQSIKGLYKIRLSEKLDSVTDLRTFGKSDGLPTDFDIHVFKVENRVVFTTGQLLYTWNDLSGKIIPYDELNNQLAGFESSTRIVSVLDNTYWFLKKDDIALFQVKNGKAKMLVKIFLPSYGIRMMDKYENVIRIDEDRSLLCLDNGFAILNMKRLLSERKDNSKLFFRNVFCLDSKGQKKRMNPGNSVLTIPHSQNSLSVSFSYINSNNVRNLFQSKLANIENEWSPVSENSSVSYNRLPKGEYKLMVRTLNERGMFTNPIILRFRVFPAWYESIVGYLLYTFVIIVIVVASIYLYRRRFLRKQARLRERAELLVVQQKQRSEKEIINLQNEKLQSEVRYKTIQLADSTMSLIKKNELLIEIRRELDQQKKVLGSQYPSYFSERIQSLINKNMSTDQDWEMFEVLFDQAHQDFFKRLKSAFPDLTQSDLKICAYLKLNLSSKEIAPLLNISFRGVETRRYRLRKRLGLSSDSNLVDFILSF